MNQIGIAVIDNMVDIETGMSCGAADYFVKPIDTRRLLERLRELSS